MKKNINWAIWGIEFIAEDFMEKLNRENRVYALGCKNIEKMKAYSQKYHIENLYVDLEDLLNDQNVDIVYISTLGNEHFEAIMNCLQHKKHVFCEKAMFANSHDAKQAYDYAMVQQLFIGEANTIFYMPLYQEIKNRKAELGNIKMLKAEFGSLKEEDRNADIYQKEKCGGALYDIGIYALSAVCSFIDCTDAELVSFQKTHAFGVDEQWSICLKTSQKVLATINLDIRCKLPKQFILAGDLAYIEMYNYPRADQCDIVYPDTSRETITWGDSAEAVLYEIKKVEEQLLNQQYLENDTMKYTLDAMMLMDKLRTNKEGNDYD